MKRVLKRSLYLFSVVTLGLMLFPRFVYAYIDPGTGSYIIQVLIAAVVGSLFALKIYWRRLVSFLKKVFSKGGK